MSDLYQAVRKLTDALKKKDSVNRVSRSGMARRTVEKHPRIAIVLHTCLDRWFARDAPF